MPDEIGDATLMEDLALGSFLVKDDIERRIFVVLHSFVVRTDKNHS